MKEISKLLEPTAEKAAQNLLGCLLIREINGQKLIGMIVETEAYDQSDSASHSYRGKTPRTDVMFGPAGRAYVYFTYGMHYCFNVVMGGEGHGSAVLIRALEPLDGITEMRLRRQKQDIHDLCNGPAKLCYALGINKELNGHNLAKRPLKIVLGRTIKKDQIVKTTRIGISKDTHRLWRFYIKDNPFVSKR